ncbi:hypothetical protein M0R88_14610 [Halorussus gelatinilyticus]|uniref:DUF7260 domain-containing protein n=1 Tax=Halorussus gelatinilyticus TaxID=2937524 RepID=A0A8U0II29_9EURY|nr:hypothetical protein [Halorussus gelatinilyticus]UPV99738.1 hypothetical protein M0R88_14610 [Halorussus gelatinilyticus]
MTQRFAGSDGEASFDPRTPAAVERAASERDRIEEKVAAFGEFRERVADVPADAGGRGSRTARSGRSAGGTLAVGTTASSSADGTATVREAFGETVLAYADADSMQEAMADELSPELTAALSPAAGEFSTGLKRQLVSRADQRRKECRLLADGIEGERERIRAIADEFEGILDRLATADETPLLQLGFEELRARHDRLAAFRETCDRLATERQAAIRETRNDGLIGIREAELIAHLYGEFTDSHPVLADLAELDALLADCQFAVRKHLCARV